MNQATDLVSRASVARVLVELDISKTYPTKIWLGYELNGYFQKVEFEKLLIFCSHCKMHGHSLSECFKLHPHLKKDKEIVRSAKMQVCNTNVDVNENLMEGNGIMNVPSKPVIKDVPSFIGNEPNLDLTCDVGESKKSSNVVHTVSDPSSSSISYASLQNVTQLIVVDENNNTDAFTKTLAENNQDFFPHGEVVPLVENPNIALTVAKNNLCNGNHVIFREEEVMPSQGNLPLVVAEKENGLI
ncbi:hypothetical protein MA16_Dca020781 [Dendrobium catenatum]|uniref:Zinc knuckle CX2CX4HX4C domain-containing protein n=1 Tax=Dendrobium catenatum TaxID=906689 RepID=A0A2I0W639_9ASPA|nr:hypothetical protein MA16_Dca020781 [Dendrobium catenatum]